MRRSRSSTPASLAAAEAAQSTTLAAVLAREVGGEDPSFEFGTGVSSSKLCVVLNGVPKLQAYGPPSV
jgi:hypothetical protein